MTRPHRAALAGLLLGCVGGSPLAQQAGSPLLFVQTTYSDRARLHRIAERFQRVIVDERNQTARWEAAYGEYLALRREGIVATAGLGAGRHFVFVRGSDASGAVGTPNAAYFTATAP